MKTALLVLGGLLLAGNGRAQQLRGSFGTRKEEMGFESYFLRFEGQRFFYRSGGCLGTWEGSGTYRLAHRQLTLQFEHSAADTVELVMRPGRPTDSPSTFRFLVQMWQDGQYAGMPGVTVSSRRARKSASTDQNGEAVLQYDTSMADTLEVSYFPSSTVYVPVQAGLNQSFTVRLYQKPRYFAAGTTLKLHIVQQTSQALSLEQFLYTDDDDKPQYLRFRVSRLSDAEAVRLPKP